MLSAMYYEIGAKVSKDRPVTVEMKAYGDADTREVFEAHVVAGLETIIASMLAARCEHNDPLQSRLNEPL